MSERLCLICKHFYFDGGSPYYSEMTPGESFHMGCSMELWPGEQRGRGRSDLDHMNTADFVRLNRTAETCESFQANAPEAE